MPVAMRHHVEQLVRADEREIADFVEAAESRDELGPRHKSEPFAQYWREIAPALVEAYADKVGVWRKCRDEVGMDKLLSTPSIGMMVGANASMIYAVVVEGRAPGEPQQILRGLGRERRADDDVDESPGHHVDPVLAPHPARRVFEVAEALLHEGEPGAGHLLGRHQILPYLTQARRYALALRRAERGV